HELQRWGLDGRFRDDQALRLRRQRRRGRPPGRCGSDGGQVRHRKRVGTHLCADRGVEAAAGGHGGAGGDVDGAGGGGHGGGGREPAGERGRQRGGGLRAVPGGRGERWRAGDGGALPGELGQHAGGQREPRAERAGGGRGGERGDVGGGDGDGVERAAAGDQRGAGD